MTKLLGISGSLRAGSYNTALLRTAVPLAPNGTTLDIALLQDIPLYNGDLEEKEGVPQAVKDLKARILACDGLILATPEYNNGIPGVFKNAIDWLSRPTPDIPDAFLHRPVAIMGASPGGFGTLLSQNSWLSVLRALGMQHWSGGRMLVSRVHQYANEKGEIEDEDLHAQLRKFLSGYIDFVKDKKSGSDK